MIKSPIELTKVLCDQAKNSGLVSSAIVIVMGDDGRISKTEFGFNKKKIENTANLPVVNDETSPESVVADKEAKSATKL